MKKLLITAFALLAFAAGSQAQTNNKNAKNMKTIALTKADFLKKVADYEKNPEEWKYLGDKPALIDFYASWCGPCKALAPVLEELAAEYGDRIYIYKINTEEEQELAAAFGIRSIPTLLFIPMEGKPQMAQGALPKASLKEAIDKAEPPLPADPDLPRGRDLAGGELPSADRPRKMHRMRQMRETLRHAGGI